MEYSFLQKITGILFRPLSTFRILREESPIDAFFLWGIGLVFFIGVITVATIAGINRSLCWPWSVISAMYSTPGSISFYCFVALLLLLMWGISAHIWVWIAGGRGIINTFRVVMYVSVPVFFLSWIPWLGFLAVPWMIILYLVAVREFHQIPFGKAALATFGLLLLPIIRIAMLVLTMLASPGGISGFEDSPQFILVKEDLPSSFTKLTVDEVPPSRFLNTEKTAGCLRYFRVSISEDPALASDPMTVMNSVALLPSQKGIEYLNDLKINVGPGDPGISCPSLGEVTYCRKYTTINSQTGKNFVNYRIAFVKHDTVEQFSSLGAVVNTSKVNEIARRAAAKIP